MKFSKKQILSISILLVFFLLFLFGLYVESLIPICVAFGFLIISLQKKWFSLGFFLDSVDINNPKTQKKIIITLAVLSILMFSTVIYQVAKKDLNNLFILFGGFIIIWVVFVLLSKNKN